MIKERKLQHQSQRDFGITIEVICDGNKDGKSEISTDTMFSASYVRIRVTKFI